jgi:hypothetical protein
LLFFLLFSFFFAFLSLEFQTNTHIAHYAQLTTLSTLHPISRPHHTSHQTISPPHLLHPTSHPTSHHPTSRTHPPGPSEGQGGALGGPHRPGGFAAPLLRAVPGAHADRGDVLPLAVIQTCFSQVCGSWLLLCCCVVVLLCCVTNSVLALLHLCAAFFGVCFVLTYFAILPCITLHFPIHRLPVGSILSASALRAAEAPVPEFSFLRLETQERVYYLVSVCMCLCVGEGLYSVIMCVSECSFLRLETQEERITW